MEKLVCGLLRSPRLFVVFEITKIVTFSLLWVCIHPSCVEVIEIVIWVYGYPSCVEVTVEEFWFVFIPPSIEVIVVEFWLSASSL